ncbi:cysteine desulfurase-like protein [Brevibacillus fluminis]|uniref:Cysteine desulfurase-like protein n=1 Tax=Brevibacillus fluminis TaxID=511487 RepID=A0A3M8DA89_9BACL|nr:cysteine desulfurase-like protein [Brevibacillus fluminis]RNB84491.1 cysteine desulfurase-like protein [Brevibacillus fluminis]
MSFAVMELRKDFPSLSRTVSGYQAAYFDGPGGTQVPRQVIQAISHYYETCNANAHGPFVTSAETDQIVDRTREAAAALLGAPSPASISFGANMTSLAFALARALSRTIAPGDEVVITDLDHEANRGPWQTLAERGAIVHSVAITVDGRIDMEDFKSKLSPKTKIVAVGCSSNSLGTVNDLATIRELTHAIDALLIVDAVHFAPHFPIDVIELDCDFLLCSAYKFYGPHVGILYAREGLLDTLPTDKLRAQDDAAPYRIETGTPNFAALAGVTAAIEYIAAVGVGATLRQQLLTGMALVHDYEDALARKLYDGLSQMDHIQIFGQPFGDGLRAPTISFTVAGMNSGDVAAYLGERGLFVWGGHFYAMRIYEVYQLEEQGGLVRVGISLYNTEEEVDRLLEAVKALNETRTTTVS